MHPHFLIKFPPDLSPEIRKGLAEKSLGHMTFASTDTLNANDSHREFEMTFKNNSYHATLVDLPCIIEPQKTFNRQLYFKCGNISQIIIVRSLEDKGKPLSSLKGVDVLMSREGTREYRLNSGLTYPSKEIRERFLHKRAVCQCEDNTDLTRKCKTCNRLPV